jgi:hypothetical protein
MELTRITAIIIASLALSYANAQTTAPPPAGTKQVIPEKQGAPLQSGRSESLSSKLSETGGVIKPKEGVDPNMKAPAPDPTPHTTPVIPPSATGGDTAK